MTWFGAEIDGPLIVVRAIHFAASAVTAGAPIFRAVVAEPALRSQRQASAIVQSQIRGVAWIGLAVAMASGLTWALLVTMSLSAEGAGEAVMSGALRDVLNLTQFGLVSQIRLVLAILLATCLAFDRFAPARWLALAFALGFVGSIAWTGHAGSTAGRLGNLHLAADTLHLIGAAAWIGALPSLVFLLAAVRGNKALAGASLAQSAAQRFSTLGTISVGTLLVSGIINAWILVGSFRGLIFNGYGTVLMLKLAVFAAMLGFAAVNRFWLTPRLTGSPDDAALRQLTRNSVIEIVLGFVIFAIVGLLGTLHPASHFM
jgi:putative copper resistance protein D